MLRLPNCDELRALKLGATVNVLYHRSGPDATIDRFLFRHAPELIFFCIGVAMIAIYVYG